MAHPVKSARFRFIFYLSLFLLALSAGTVGFAVLEKMGIVESLYFVIVTMATVGYGDISPQSVAGRLLAILVIVVGVGTFLSMIANAAEMFLSKREHRSRMHKLNMVIGLFFSEVGTGLLTVCSDADPRREEIRESLRIEGDWTAEDFARVRRQLEKQEFELDPDRVSLPDLARLLRGERRFMVGLLENPAVMEHEDFTDVLWSGFHLADELEAREDVSGLVSFDRAHIMGDTQRVYGLLVVQWLRYMQHMQSRYPYLFARAVRENPFVVKKSAVLQQLEEEDA